MFRQGEKNIFFVLQILEWNKNIEASQKRISL